MFKNGGKIDHHIFQITLLFGFNFTVFYQTLPNKHLGWGGDRNVVIKLLPSTCMLDITDARCVWVFVTHAGGTGGQCSQRDTGRCQAPHSDHR